MSGETRVTPTIGRIVIYQLKDDDATQINRRRTAARDHMGEHRINNTGVMVHVGNSVSQGDRFPMMITRVWGDGPDALVNGQVHLDGGDVFWATSVGVGTVAGMWMWPARS